MRRWTAWLLALVLALSLTACGTAPDVPETQDLPPAQEAADPSQTSALPPEDKEAEDGDTAPDMADPSAEDPSALEESLPEDGVYDSRDDVALYLHLYGHLPGNYITKKDAQALGWSGGSLEPYAPGMCIGGSRFGNYEGLLPEAQGRTYTECDIDTLGASSRGAKRIVFSNDGLIYYTDDHYASFTLLYGEESDG